MHICYIDEAGCTGMLPSSMSDIQPVFILGGIIIDQTRLHDLTDAFLSLKRRYFPNLRLPNNVVPQRPLDWGKIEVKGADIRRMLASKSRHRRSALSFLSDLLSLMEDHQIRILARVMTKGINKPIKGQALYTSWLQRLCKTFQHFLNSINDEGFLIADSRSKKQNDIASHSIFTQKYRAAGDDFQRILEVPSFGHSENHVGIQIADLFCSALLFPMAIDAFCASQISSCHVRGNNYTILRQKLGHRLSKLQHRYQSSASLWKGGIETTDQLGNEHPKFLLRVQ